MAVRKELTEVGCVILVLEACDDCCGFEADGWEVAGPEKLFCPTLLPVIGRSEFQSDQTALPVVPAGCNICVETETVICFGLFRGVVVPGCTFPGHGVSWADIVLVALACESII